MQKLQIYILFECVACHAGNFVFDGNYLDEFSQRAEGFACWNCKTNQKINSISYELVDCATPMQPGREYLKSKSSDVEIIKPDNKK